MIKVSNAFRQLIFEGKINYLEYVDLTLTDGTELSLKNKDLWQGGISMEDAVSSSDSFSLGSAIINKCKISICNITDEYSEYDFDNALVKTYIGLELPDGTVEKFQKGTYVVDDPSYDGSIITLSCLDNMSKFDRQYSESKLVYPSTLESIVKDACDVCGVALNTSKIPHGDYTVQTRPSDEAITFRDVIAWAAQIAGCFARCNTVGQLEFKWYNQEALERIGYDGGSFDKEDPGRYVTGDTANGGSFNPWDNGDNVDGGTFKDFESIHYIYSHYSTPNVSTDDVVITGVRVIENVDNENHSGATVTYMSGKDGYVIEVSGNDLIQNNSGLDISNWLGEQLIGFRFRRATLNHSSDPTIEAGDVAIAFNRKNQSFPILVSSTRFSTGSSQETESSAETPTKNSAQQFSQSVKNYVEFRNGIADERSAREKAQEELKTRIDNSSGLFTTEEKMPDGSTVFYMHDKPKLSDSSIVWKMTAEAWGVSTDGGKSYNAGMTVDGNTIVRILTATGVNADWIKTGKLEVVDEEGNSIFLVDIDTGQVSISGNHIQIGGSSVVQALANAVAESNSYADGKLASYADTVTKDFSEVQKQLDGQIESFFEKYEPTMLNKPASEWTTENQRLAHEGDIFYWEKDDGTSYAYRFMKDPDTSRWGWNLIQDTDITKAIADAAHAQDTADHKRRNFVITPYPPYDIGDQWSNGTDVLVCVTSRSSGDFVKGDWQKLNAYTDDTLAQQALDEAKKAHNLTIILDNEYQGIPTDSNGNYDSPLSVKTTVQTFYGHQDVSSACHYATSKTDGVTGSWSNTTRTYAITELSTDVGWVDITASYLGQFTVTKRFNVSKVKAGTNGTNGADGRTYILQPSATVIKQKKDGTTAPSYIDFNAYYRDGSSADKTEYAGRFKIEKSDDGFIWTTVYTSPADESSVRYSVYNILTDGDGVVVVDENGYAIAVQDGTTIVRCTLYAAGGTTTILDIQTVPLVIDVDALSHEDIFNLLTNNGEMKGIYQEGNQLYISFTYAKGGQLTLGGVDDKYGILQVMGDDNSLDGIWDNRGIELRFGYFKKSGVITLTGGSQHNFETIITNSIGTLIDGKRVFVSGPLVTSTEVCGYAIGVGDAFKYLGLGTTSSSIEGEAKTYYMINNGYNPGGHEQRHIFEEDMFCSGRITAYRIQPGTSGGTYFGGGTWEDEPTILCKDGNFYVDKKIGCGGRIIAFQVQPGTSGSTYFGGGTWLNTSAILCNDGNFYVNGNIGCSADGYVKGLHLGSGVSYVYSENNDGNIYFRYTTAAGDTAYSSIRGIMNAVSDERKKTNIKPIAYEDIAEFFDRMVPISYGIPSQDDKFHVGFSAQKLEQAMAECGLPDNMAIIQKEPERDDDGNRIPDQYEYRLNYNEIVPILTAKIQQQDKEIKELKKEIEEIKNMIREVL